MKTGLAGKTEILVHLIQRALQLLDNARFFLVTPHVLVIDDQVEIADAISQILQKRGCQVSTVYEVKTSTLEHVKHVGPDLVICDIHLGATNGIEFLRDLRLQTERSPSMIVISGQSMPERSVAPFISAWIPKPLDATQLFETTIKTLILRASYNGREPKLTIRCAVLQNGKKIGITQTISPDGLTMSSLMPLFVGDSIDLEIAYPDQQSIHGRCRVIWTAREDESQVSGLQFLNISESDRNWLMDFVHTQSILRFLPWTECATKSEAYRGWH